jgi:hypothetical protein
MLNECSHSLSWDARVELEGRQRASDRRVARPREVVVPFLFSACDACGEKGLRASHITRT